MFERQEYVEKLKNLIRKNNGQLTDAEIAALAERYLVLGKLSLGMWLKELVKKSRDPP